MDAFQEHEGFTEARVRFASPEALCRTPLLDRECAHRADDEDGTRRLRMAIPPGGVPAGEGAAEITLRPAGRILEHSGEHDREHNGRDAALRRGNRLVWSGRIAELREGGLRLEMTTESRSVLAITIGAFLRAALIAAGLVGCGLAALVLVGRRRIRRDPERWAPADPG